MAITDSFRKALSDANVTRLRIMMKDSLLGDPTFAEFDEMSHLAGGVPGLYDDHDGRRFESEDTWSDDYMNKQMVQVVGNFSHERLSHIKDIVRKLHPAARPRQYTTTSSTASSTWQGGKGYASGEFAERRRQANSGQSDYQRRKEYDKRHGQYREVKIATGAVAGAVVGGAVVAIAGAPVIGGVAIGAALGGMTVVVLTKEGR